MLVLLGAHHIFHISRIRVNYLTRQKVERILAVPNLSRHGARNRRFLDRRILVRSVSMNEGEIVVQGRTILWPVVALLIREDFNS